MFRMICTTFVPSWRGQSLPTPWTRIDRWRLRLSMTLADLGALRYYGRTFRLLTAAEREALLARLLLHRWPQVRQAARRWKELALLTA